MERLNLTSGRYIPAGDGDVETRLRRMETYLGGMSEELERMLAAVGVALNRLETAREEEDA